ncbi:hypothetical protein ES703_29697 [subsurface metagenome]
MTHDLTPPDIKKTCPICSAKYTTKELAPNPTCGYAHCIIAARDQGLPFIHPYPISPVIPATGK